MRTQDPLTRTKAEYADLLEKIKSADSAVGIDAPLTHAIIIEYLRQITKRLDSLEKRLGE